MVENHQDIYASLSPETAARAKKIAIDVETFLTSEGAQRYFAFQVSSSLTDNGGDHVTAFRKGLESTREGDSKRFLV